MGSVQGTKGGVDSILRKETEVPSAPAPAPQAPVVDKPTEGRLEIALRITGSFEGTKGFAQVTGDFDGMGISVGVLQWNLGMESLQGRILRPYIDRHGSIDELEIFPTRIDHLAHLGARQSVQWARQNMLSGTSVKPEWQSAWSRFMGRPEVVKLQMEACAGVEQSANRLMTGLGLNSLRAFCWAFDVVTHNGGMKGVTLKTPDRAAARRELAALSPSRLGGKDMTKNQAQWARMIDEVTDEQVSLLRTTIARARLSRPEFLSDVVNRKGAIAMGTGWVHATWREFQNLT